MVRARCKVRRRRIRRFGPSPCSWTKEMLACAAREHLLFGEKKGKKKRKRNNDIALAKEASCILCNFCHIIIRERSLRSRGRSSPPFLPFSVSGCAPTHKSSARNLLRRAKKECVIMPRYRRRRQVDCIGPAHSWRTGTSYHQTLCTVYAYFNPLFSSEPNASSPETTPCRTYLLLRFYLPTSVIQF